MSRTDDPTAARFPVSSRVHPGIRRCYSELRLSFPLLKTEGLWWEGTLHGQYFIVIDFTAQEDVDAAAIAKWVRSNSPATAQLRIATEPADGMHLVPELSLEDTWRGVGIDRNLPHLEADLNLELPTWFPAFTVSRQPGAVSIEIERPLSDWESAILRDAYNELQPGVDLQVVVAAPSQTENSKHAEVLALIKRVDALSLIPARQLAALPAPVRSLVEEDDAAWRTARTTLGTPDFNGIVALPEPWRAHKSRCLLDASVFPPPNIRNFLALFDLVIVVLPLAEKEASALASLGVTLQELARLMELGRVQVITPQSIPRYAPDTLALLAEASPHSLLLSRSLAATTVAQMRRRFPLLFPPLAPTERVELARELIQLAGREEDQTVAKRTVALARALSSGWMFGEPMIHRRGAMATAPYGLGAVLANSTDVQNNIAWFSLVTAAYNVEWACGLEATVVASEVGGFSDQAALGVLATAYSGLRSGPILVAENALQQVAGELLAINNNAPVLEVATAFAGGDITRMRELAIRVTSANMEASVLADAVQRFNDEVRRFERRPDLLARLDLLSVLGMGATAIYPEHGLLIQGGRWALGFLARHAGTKWAGRAPRIVGTLLDRINGPVSREAPDVVMVARMRRALKDG